MSDGKVGENLILTSFFKITENILDIGPRKKKRMTMTKDAEGKRASHAGRRGFLSSKNN